MTVGGLPDIHRFSRDVHRDKPVGGSIGGKWQDRSGRKHDLRVFGAMTPPGTGELTLTGDEIFFFGIWWTFKF
jgi:hypothetical protein